MIPATYQAPVKKALHAAFGITEWETITPLTTGLSTALVFQVVVSGTPYLLKIITNNDALSDPTHQFTCMAIAAGGGIAPRVHYTSIEDKISITGFVAAHPFDLDTARDKMAELLRNMHSLPPFPRRRNYLESADIFINRFRDARILPGNITEKLFESYARIRKVYAIRDEDMVSCHNDLKPENIISDGKRPWLVDLEAAFLNDRNVDLVVVANFVLRDEQDEAIYLERYFGKAASEYQLARFFLMRQIIHMFYFSIFLLIGSTGKPVDPSRPRPGFREFHDDVWNGRISLAANEPKITYGLVHMDQLLRNLQLERFKESLNFLSRYREH